MTGKLNLRLDGRVAIITGAGRGLGRAYALELARRGASVVVNDAGFNMAGTDAGGKEPADAVVREISLAGGKAVASYHDITQAEQARALVALALSSFGSVDILVNNAGNNRHAIFPEVRLEDMRAILDVHLIGPMLLSQAVYPHMQKRRHGRIVLTTSQVGFQGKVDSVAYGAAKNAVIGLMHGMKLDATR
ncbi:MAG: SDR family NAD(P)-dependent oxidoreductase, partial [Burkholderiaceae bacterium]